MFKGIQHKSRLLFGLVDSKADLETVRLEHFYGPTYEDRNSYKINGLKSLIEDEDHFEPSRLTVIYLHGYLENCEVESVHVIVEAYLKRNDINLIVLDWGKLADGNYMFDAVINAKQLALELAEQLIAVSDYGLDINRLHLVGHSLGGQMAGMIGREVIKISTKTKKIKRITALDPAFPMFYLMKVFTPLNKDDADFVDVIHTDAWFYGAPFSTGTVDFWPNGGKTLQPGCPKRNYKLLTDNDLCSHRRSWWFWVESLDESYSQNFNAVKCKSWSDFVNGKTNNEQRTDIVMGHLCPSDLIGDYYLQTNGKPPYSRGAEGIIYVDPKKLPGSENETNTI